MELVKKNLLILFFIIVSCSVVFAQEIKRVDSVITKSNYFSKLSCEFKYTKAYIISGSFGDYLYLYDNATGYAIFQDITEIAEEAFDMSKSFGTDFLTEFKEANYEIEIDDEAYMEFTTTQRNGCEITKIFRPETLLEERHLVATIVKKGNLYRAAEEEWASLSQAISYVTERSARYSTHAFSDIKLVANRSLNAAVFKAE